MSRIAEALDPTAYGATYPNAPGFKEPTTSREAAQRVAPRVRDLHAAILAQLALADLTTDECAARMGEDRLAIRPRFTELLKAGKIRATNERRKNVSGMSAKVWGLCRQNT